VPRVRRTHHRRRFRPPRLAVAAVLLWGLALAGPAAGQNQKLPMWNVPPGTRMVQDAVGFDLPVGIAFLNHPGDDPQDPLYLVTELRGAIKVVTRERQVRVFADDTGTYLPTGAPMPDVAAQIGQTGICVAPDDSAVYTTGVIPVGKLRVNRIVRWESVGPRRWAKGRVAAEFTDIFRNDEASNPHQIGNCFIGAEGKLWVGTGDGSHHRTSHLINHANGKLLRLNPDFTAPADNPFYNPSNPAGIPSYVFASGLRNPFAIAEVAPRQVWIADNGPTVDRLLNIEPGRDYPWDGSNTSLIYNNALTWPKSIGPAAMIHEGAEPVLPGTENSLLITGSFLTHLVRVPVHPQFGVTGPPETLVTRNDPAEQAFTGIARGPDGIYIAHMRYGPPGTPPSAILKLMPDETGAAPQPRRLDGRAIFQNVGCVGCHQLGGLGGVSGPSLDNVVNRLRGRLASDEYRESLAALSMDDLRRGEFADLLQQLRKGEGSIDARVRRWIAARLDYPKFDDPQAAMPEPALSAEQIDAVAGYLMQAGDVTAEQDIIEHSPGERLKTYFFQHIDQFLAAMLVLGILIGLFLRTTLRLLWWPVQRLRRR